MKIHVSCILSTSLATLRWATLNAPFSGRLECPLFYFRGLFLMLICPYVRLGYLIYLCVDRELMYEEVSICRPAGRLRGPRGVLLP